MKKMLLALFAFASLQASAQVPVMINYTGATPSQLTSYKGKTYFLVDQNNYELWVTDGTANGTHEFMDGINYPRILGEYNGRLYFTASDATYGGELWSTDGTAAGTRMLKDINPTGSSEVSKFTVVGNKLYFTAWDGVHGSEWWISDGTTAGTRMIADLEPSQGHRDGYIHSYVPFGNTIIFSRELEDVYNNGRTDVWILDGGSGTPVNLTSHIPISSFISQNGIYMTVVNNKVYFDYNTTKEGSEIAVTDGTVSGTKILDVTPGSNGTAPMDLLSFNGKLLFTGYNTNFLYASDGTVAGTVSLGVKALDPEYAIAGSVLYVVGWDASNAYGKELWKTDGTPAGTSMIKDIWPGTTGSIPYHLTYTGGKLYFSANDGTNAAQPWVSDGTAAGTFMLKKLYSGNSSGAYARYFTEYNNKVYFVAKNENFGFQLFETTGTTESTAVIQPANASSTSPLGTNGYPNPLVLTNGMMMFAASYDGSIALYRLGGSAGPTAVDDHVIAQLSIYPNPGHDFINFSLNEAVTGQSRYRIIDINGKTLKMGKLSSQVEVSSLPKGVYHVEVSNGAKTRYMKFVKL